MPNNWQTVVVLGQLWWGFSIQMWVSLGWLIGIGLCPVSRSPVSMGLLLVCFQSPLSLTIGLHSGFPFCIFQFWKPWYKFNSTLVSFMWIRGYVFFSRFGKTGKPLQSSRPLHLLCSSTNFVRRSCHTSCFVSKSKTTIQTYLTSWCQSLSSPCLLKTSTGQALHSSPDFDMSDQDKRNRKQWKVEQCLYHRSAGRQKRNFTKNICSLFFLTCGSATFGNLGSWRHRKVPEVHRYIKCTSSNHAVQQERNKTANVQTRSAQKKPKCKHYSH